MAKRPTYIVTGGAGFIGANLTAALLARSPRPFVVVIDSFRSGSFANLVEACERRAAGPFDGSVISLSTSEIDFAEVLETYPAQAVFHIGAITDTTVSSETTMLRENVEGFSAMLEACDEARTPLVYASSAATYGTPPQTAQRKPFPLGAAGKPNNVYGFSKWLMECEHRRFAERTAKRRDREPMVVGLRYFNVFGPGEARKGKMASMVYQLTMQVLAGRSPRLFADGTQARDQVYVDDVVDCTLAAAGLGKRAPRPGVYNLGSGVATSFNQIADAIRAALGLSDQERPTDYFDMPPDIRRFYQDYTCADMTETARGLGWKPKHDPVRAMGAYAKFLSESSATL
ncbi:MAG: NAD-dependent epimerase/dehydratase family protein [Phycisphaeraceae bacterium]|nr:NAD-dependent epimerase/dehydratase family protein [Phycisphaeraceae bacterium]